MIPKEPIRSVGEVVDPAKYSAYPYEQERCRLIAERISVGEGRRALDVGAGPGFFCRLLTERGWRVTAIDADAENLKQAAKSVVEVFQGDAIEILSQRPAGGYDFVLALELIEHLPRWRGRVLLRELRRVLKPAGRLLLSTPNRYSPEGLVGYYFNEKFRGVRPWNAWDPTHVHVYSSREILAMLRREGFVVEAVTGYWYEVRLPLLGRVRLPLSSSTRWPMNRLGFNLIVECCV